MKNNDPKIENHVRKKQLKTQCHIWHKTQITMKKLLLLITQRKPVSISQQNHHHKSHSRIFQHFSFSKYLHTSPAVCAEKKKTEKPKPKPPRMKTFSVYRYNPHTPNVKPRMQTYQIDLNTYDHLQKNKQQQQEFAFKCNFFL